MPASLGAFVHYLDDRACSSTPVREQRSSRRADDGVIHFGAIHFVGMLWIAEESMRR
ncbi:MAG: hypothetical protein ACR2HQ_11565 [Ilumatobacteraceae bacterium]